MVLAIEMGVVFVLLTAILIALYVAWQNAKFVGDRLKKKQVMKRLMAGGAAIILAVVVAISTMVPAFAAESDTAQSNEQFEIVDPKYEGDTNNYVTLPDAPVKEMYTFKGWSVDGSTELHSAGESIFISDGHKMQLQPVYEAKSEVPEATAAPVTALKNISDTQQDSSNVAAQDATSKADKNDDDSGLRIGIIGIVLFLLGLIPLFEAKWQASYGNDEIATALAKLALIAGMASVAFFVYAAICFS